MSKRIAAEDVALGAALNVGAVASTYSLIQMPKITELLPAYAILSALDIAYIAFTGKMYHNAYKELTNPPEKDKNNEHAPHI